MKTTKPQAPSELLPPTDLDIAYDQTMAEVRINKIVQKLFWYDNLPDAEQCLELIKAWRQHRAILKGLGIENAYTSTMVVGGRPARDDGWTAINSAEDLPKESGEYLITFRWDDEGEDWNYLITFRWDDEGEDWNVTSCAYHTDNGRWWSPDMDSISSFTVSAWQPLPEPYKGDQMSKELTEKERGYNEALHWAANWLLGQSEAHEDAIKDFAKNISDSIQAHKKPWDVVRSPSACNVCGVECDGWKDGIQPVCPEHCEDHDYEYVREDRRHECKHCFQVAPPEYFDID